jgi:hypothetical protein
MIREQSSAQTRLTRRGLLVGAPAATLALGAARERARPRVAAIAAEYTKGSPAQAIVDRFLDGFGWESHHHHPAVDVVSLHVAKKTEGDLSQERARRHESLRLCDTVDEALTLGKDGLEVDGVLLFESGRSEPPKEQGRGRERGQAVFPQVVAAFRRAGRAVPVFWSGPLSEDWAQAGQMCKAVGELGFPLLAGSPLPLTWRLPALEVPFGAGVEEALYVGPGTAPGALFEGLEAIQAMVERRRGGETGVAWLEALHGPAVWRALAQGSWEAGGWDMGLFEACLCRSHTLTSPRQGYGNAYPEASQIPALVKEPLAFRFAYSDGLKATLLLLQGLVGDRTFAARLNGTKSPISTQFYLPGPASGKTLDNGFNPLVRAIEGMFETGKAPVPLERSLLATGLAIAAAEALGRAGTRIETLHLALRYEAPRKSVYWRS